MPPCWPVFLLFYVVPFGQVVWDSLSQGTGKSQLFVGLENYTRMFQNDMFLQAFGNTLRFLGIGLPVILVLAYALALFLKSQAQRFRMLRAVFLLPYVMPVAGTVLLAPLAEECFIRGLIFQGLHRKNRWAAYALSTLAFCCLHIYGYIGAYPPLTLVLCALDYVPAGIALAWSYEKADTIFAPILMHCLINALAFQALG